MSPPDLCSVHTFETNQDSQCKEYLHVHCQVTGDIEPGYKIKINVTSSENRAPSLTVPISINIDNSGEMTGSIVVKLFGSTAFNSKPARENRALLVLCVSCCAEFATLACYELNVLQVTASVPETCIS